MEIPLLELETEDKILPLLELETEGEILPKSGRSSLLELEQLTQDLSKLTSQEERLDYLQFMQSNHNPRLNSVMTRISEISKIRNVDKYIQNFESKADILMDFSKSDFVDPIRALVQKPIDLSIMYWNVEVVNAVSPANFWVRSYELLPFLDVTTKEINKFYTEYHAEHAPIGFDDLRLGGFYAVKTDCDKDKPWARCKIIEPFSKTLPIMALLVDSGSLVSILPENFRPLTVSFCTLPVQAYEASLGMIDPETPRKACTPEVCLRFQKRVNGNGFPSVVRGLTLESGDFKPIKLFLVDTSSDPDKWIHREF